MEYIPLYGWEVAQKLGISDSKFFRLYADKIPHIKKGARRLYSPADVDLFIKKTGYDTAKP